MKKCAKGFSFVFAATLIALGASVASANPGGEELSEESVEEVEETDEIDAADIQRAQEAFNRGASLYYEGSFGDAIVEFRRAQQRYPHPIFAHNIARANEELERYDRALDAAQEARELHDNATRAQDRLPEDAEAVNHGLIVSLEARLASRSLAEAVAERQETIDESVEAPEPVSSWGLMGWSGVAMSVVGAGALTGAMVMDRQIASDIDALESDTSMSEQEFQNEVDSLEGQQTAGRVFLFSGAGLLAVGTTLVVLDLVGGPSDDQGLSMGPSLERPGMEMMVRW